MPLHLAFLGCGFITRVHSRHLKRLRPEISWSYASRDAAKSAAYCREFGGSGSYGSVGSLLYSREIPSLFTGLRLSKLFGRKGCITFESNGVLSRGTGFPRLMVPGFRDIRGYRAM
jgi:hypothetical protein